MTDTERQSSAPATPRLSHVELTWIEKKIERWIRFGHPAEDQIIDRQRRIVSRIDILRATAQGEPYTTVPFVRPGGEILLRIHGWPKVERVLQLIDSIEAIEVDPADAPPDYWRHVHNRLTAREEPRPYNRAHHRAWLLRRKLAP